VIAVVGTTGVGKSRLAVELALSVKSNPIDRSPGPGLWKNGRVINADAMQTYRGLDIISNRMPPEEQCGIDHLLMNIRGVGDDYVVGEWVHDATDLIEESHQRDAVPIVAGGTLYWIQHLLFPERLASDPKNQSKVSADAVLQSPELSAAISTLPEPLLSLYQHLPDRGSVSSMSEENIYNLHELLRRIDPDMAQRWHWKDSRKVLRSLEIIKESGRLASHVMRDQDSTKSLPKYRALIFWVYANPTLLEPRLDERVDQMVQEGLLREIHELRAAATLSDDPEVQSKGLFQSIGYKEFEAYFNACPPRSGGDSTDLLVPDPSSPAASLFNEGLAQMKLATRQYARRQAKWLKNKLIPAVTASSSTEANRVWIYLLDASELGDSWELNVRDKAVSLMEQFLSNRDDDMPDPQSLSDLAAELLQPQRSTLLPSESLSARRKRVCEICTKDSSRPIMIEEGKEWRAHVKSRGHKNHASRGQRSEKPRKVKVEQQKVTAMDIDTT